MKCTFVTFPQVLSYFKIKNFYKTCMLQNSFFQGLKYSDVFSRIELIWISVASFLSPLVSAALGPCSCGACLRLQRLSGCGACLRLRHLSGCGASLRLRRLCGCCVSAAAEPALVPVLCPVTARRLQGAWASAGAAPGPRCSEAREIFPGQGSKPGLLPGQVALPLDHQGSPELFKETARSLL